MEREANASRRAVDGVTRDEDRCVWGAGAREGLTSILGEAKMFSSEAVV